MQKAFNFVREAKGEFNNIVWPSRQEALRLSMIVVFVSVAIGIFVGALDFGFTNLLNTVVSNR